MKNNLFTKLVLLPVVFVLFSCGGGAEYAPRGYYETGFTARSADMSLFEDEIGYEDSNTNEFDHITDNPFLRPRENPLSTFSIDVDTAGYSIVRTFLQRGHLPPKSSVRIEELINYFDYDYPPPDDGRPFAVYAETGVCPWNTEHLLARIAIKGKEFPAAGRPPVNLTFLLDVSGSMDVSNRLPLVRTAMAMLVDELGAQDKVAICVYAGAAGTVLEPTSGDNKNRILDALRRLDAGGSTAGGAGIQLAYRLAEQNFNPAAVNRVILCTDGDFNVGITNRSALVDLIKEKAKSGVYLTVLGFGMGNYRDGTLKQLASNGNGNYGYIDTIEEANKMLVRQLSGTLITIANDVKIQVEFNPATVGAYRLIGYENRLLRAEEFNDDTVDAGDIGAGHTVTAFYEIILPGSEADALPGVDPLRYAIQRDEGGPAVLADELATVKIRYKLPGETASSLISFPVRTQEIRRAGESSADFNFAAAVAAFGMLLRDSPYKGSADFQMVQTMSEASLGTDGYGYRRGFAQLVRTAKTAKALN
ncbi:MAG: von Willebrand factor type A domain-containing protein [Treponema sp.]|jgi:Ca-activated chloride channel family protein|nr:von Willebrand factor type A domain-containing protein [Treponema sp.]